MKYGYDVIRDGILYKAGEEISQPVSVGEKVAEEVAEDKTEKKRGRKTVSK